MTADSGTAGQSLRPTRNAAAQLEQLRLAGELPSPKGVALAILTICRSDDVTIEALAHVVQSDPALASRLLRLANAASFGQGRPIANIPDAMLRLGMGTVCQVAMGFSLVDQYRSGPCAAFDYARFWSHALALAVALQALGSHVRIASPGELFTCGLLARVGCLALATVYPDEYAAILRAGGGDDALLELERARLPVDHTEFTAAILTDCGMPKAFVEPIQHHEAPEASGFSEGSRPYQLAHLCYHAKRIADLAVADASRRAPLIAELMLLDGKLGLNDEQAGNLIDTIIQNWHSWGEILRIQTAALPPFAALLAAPASPPAAPAEPPTPLLLATQDNALQQRFEAVCADLPGCLPHTASSVTAAMALALEIAPPIIVVDRRLADGDGSELCKALRASEWGKTAYLIILTDDGTETAIDAVFEAGADDYLTRPLDAHLVKARLRAALHHVQLLAAWEADRARLRQFAAELAISNRKLEHYALTDLLTGLPNRRAGMDVLAQSWSAANRSGQNLAVMVLDIDYFKNINDTYGHAVGDKVLAAVARIIRATARKDDHVSRLGGEEFLVICHNADVHAALLAAERLRQIIRTARIPAGDLQVTTSISIGVAAKESAMADPDRLVAAADRALYAAKESGRDRTCVNVGGKFINALPPAS